MEGKASSAMDGRRRRTSYHRTVMLRCTAKIRRQSDHGVARSQLGRAAKQLVHVGTAATESS